MQNGCFVDRKIVDNGDNSVDYLNGKRRADVEKKTAQIPHGPCG
jgi:hypothetical protein